MNVQLDEKSEKLKKIIKTKYKSIRAFADDVGIPNTTLVTALNNGIGGMAVEKVIAICEKLEIDIKTFDPTANYSSKDLSQPETEIIKKYRALDERGKANVLAILDQEYNHSQENDGNPSENKVG